MYTYILYLQPAGNTRAAAKGVPTTALAMVIGLFFVLKYLYKVILYYNYILYRVTYLVKLHDEYLMKFLIPNILFSRCLARIFSTVGGGLPDFVNFVSELTCSSSIHINPYRIITISFYNDFPIRKH